MGRWREAATDALATFAASRVLVLAVLLVPPTQVHAYLTTWDAGFYLTIARCGYDPACGPPVSAELPAFFPLQPFAARAAGWVGFSEPWGGALLATLASFAALVLLHRLCSELGGRRVALLACAAVSFFPFSYVLSTNYSEGLFLLASIGAFAAARSRRPVLAFVAGLAAGLTRPAAIPLAIGLAADAALAPERRRATLAGAVGAVAGVALVFADLHRRRNDWLASLHAQQLGWHRSASLVDAPGELARYVRDAIVLHHAQNLLYLTAVPLAAIGLIVLWRHGIRDGMFVFAVIAVVAPLATGSAMSLPRFLMGTFPYAVAGGILLDRVDSRLRAGLLVLSAAGLVGCMWATYRGSGLAP
ncbi:MAG TPA: hypothetical protein VFD90_21025 [Gaiellales bacterium]|nr:hypothetical protein [Gaiellales bacterium]